MRNEALYTLAMLGGIVSALFLHSAPMLWREAQYQFDGVTVQGRVLQKQIAGVNLPGPRIASVSAHGGGRKGARHLVDYEFLDSAGGRYTDRSTVSTAIWQQLVVGGPVDVTYVKSHPDESRGGGTATMSLGVLIGSITLGGLVLAGTMWAILVGIQRILFNLELFRHSEPVFAIVREVVVDLTGDSGSIVQILRYTYEADDVLTGNAVEFSGTFDGIRGRRCRPGDRLLAFFDSADPQRHVLDKYGLCDEFFRSDTAGET